MKICKKPSLRSMTLRWKKWQSSKPKARKKPSPTVSFLPINCSFRRCCPIIGPMGCWKTTNKNRWHKIQRSENRRKMGINDGDPKKVGIHCSERAAFAPFINTDGTCILQRTVAFDAPSGAMQCFQPHDPAERKAAMPFLLFLFPVFHFWLFFYLRFFFFAFLLDSHSASSFLSLLLGFAAFFLFFCSPAAAGFFILTMHKSK